MNLVQNIHPGKIVPRKKKHLFYLGHGGGPNREVSGGGQGDSLEKGNRHFAEITFQFTIIFYVKCRYNNKVILSIIEKKYHLY